jgi:hypothetical protein
MRPAALATALLLIATGLAVTLPSVAMGDHQPPATVMRVEHRDHSRRGVLYG